MIMAYIVMVHIAMAYIVVAYIVMAYKGGCVQRSIDATMDAK